jgi:hypothetical protein
LGGFQLAGLIGKRDLERTWASLLPVSCCLETLMLLLFHLSEPSAPLNVHYPRRKLGAPNHQGILQGLRVFSVLTNL